MLLNGVHLLPDLSGALIYPKARLVAVSDPVGDSADRGAPQRAATALKRLGAVLRQRRPAMVLWLGDSLPRLLAEGRLAARDADDVARLAQTHDWRWVADGLPDMAVPELKAAGLTFRHRPAPGSAALGEVAAAPWPLAGLDGGLWPCFVFDGRRMVIPPFGGGTEGVNVLSPAFAALFRRPFNALILAGGRIVTRPRARLEPPAPPRIPGEAPP